MGEFPIRDKIEEVLSSMEHQNLTLEEKKNIYFEILEHLMSEGEEEGKHAYLEIRHKGLFNKLLTDEELAAFEAQVFNPHQDFQGLTQE